MNITLPALVRSDNLSKHCSEVKNISNAKIKKLVKTLQPFLKK
jgi:hypothetical protein